MKRLWIVLVAMLAVDLTFQQTVQINQKQDQNRPSVTNYTAAVVEYNPSNETDAEKFTEANTIAYLNIIKSAETKSADIIVFPEATLNKPTNPAKLPANGEAVVPCDLDIYSDVVRNISCAAKEAQTYVVIDLYMERDCHEEAAATNDVRPCTRDNINVYNTAVAFNRNGTVVAIYRKFNLFMESEVRQTLKPDIAIFETDFGVKFGLIICFDLNFENPVAKLIEKDVENFAFPTMWFSELPFYTGVQIQQSWAFSHRVNLLAAGANTALNTGSGIYSGHMGAIKSIMADPPTTKVLVAKIPTKALPHPQINANDDDDDDDNNSEIKIAHKLWKENLDKYHMHALDFEANTTQIGKICNGTICCWYNITASASKESIRATNYYSYAIGVFDGIRTFGTEKKVLVHAGTKSCSLIACKNGDLKSCAERFAEDSIEHRKISIIHAHLTAGMNASKSFLVMPSTLTSTTLLPLKVTEFSFDEIIDEDEDDEIRNTRNWLEYEIILSKPQSDLLTFGIFARDFTKDEWTADSSTTLDACRVLLSSLAVILILFLVKFN